MAAYLLIRGGEGGQNLGESAYIILERSLMQVSKHLNMGHLQYNSIVAVMTVY